MSSIPKLYIDPHAEAVALDGGVLLRNRTRTVMAGGLSAEALRHVVDAVDGSRTEAEVILSLGWRYPGAFAEKLLRGLLGVVVQPDPDSDPASSSAPSVTLTTDSSAVVVLGNGHLAQQIAQSLGGCARLEHVGLPASCLEPEFVATRASRVLLAPAGAAAAAGSGQTAVTVEWLMQQLAGARMAVCALEWVPYRAVLDVVSAARRANIPVLFVTPEPGGAIVGPTYVPHATPCWQCERLNALFPGAEARARDALPFVLCHGVIGGETDRPLEEAIATEVARVVDAVLDPPPRAPLRSQVVRFAADGARSEMPLFPNLLCSTCSEATRPDPSPLRRRALVDVAVGEDRRAASAPRHERPARHGYRSVGILGGGTAGYLTALTFRARFPEIEVTLIESRDVPIIGVGEATTPRLVEYLHNPDDLDRDIVDFHARVLPTWKLGVMYEWGLPGDYAFPWPFQYGSLLEPYIYDGNISDHCLAAMLMSSQRTPVFDNGDGTQTSLLGQIPFAYHLDNGRFVKYLREEADRAGVTYRDLLIVYAETSADGDSVEALVTESGERLRFDLYVDCSGFRSMLLERALRSPFIGYGASLFTDAAVVANVPHGGVVKPYTVAESMDNGWCWNIAFEDEDHRGYVYSSAFCSADEAEAEMRAKNPGMGDAWTLRFRSGRHEHFWKGNVVGVGNAYAFVEPLASTAIHMLLYELDLLSVALPADDEPALKDSLNREANRMWDSLRGWLAVQYRFNRKYDTPFWRACQADVDLAEAAARVARFRERAPLTKSIPIGHGAANHFLPRYTNDYFSQDYVYDVMLLGQHVDCRHREPREGEHAWRSRIRRAREAVRWALPQAEALAVARAQPEMLSELVTSPESWLGERLY